MIVLKLPIFQSRPLPTGVRNATYASLTLKSEAPEKAFADVLNPVASGPNSKLTLYPAAHWSSDSGFSRLTSTTFRLNPSSLPTPSKARPGRLASPVPGFQMMDVSTYPLRVVADTAVCTWLIGFASSACTADARLTTPPAAKPNVHLLNFIS